MEHVTRRANKSITKVINLLFTNLKTIFCVAIILVSVSATIKDLKHTKQQLTDQQTISKLKISTPFFVEMCLDEAVRNQSDVNSYELQKRIHLCPNHPFRHIGEMTVNFTKMLYLNKPLSTADSTYTLLTEKQQSICSEQLKHLKELCPLSIKKLIQRF